MNSGKPTRVDPFRPLLIEAVEKYGGKSSQDWADRLRSEHYVEKAQVEGPKGGITPLMLTTQRAQLKKVTEVGTPFANNLSIIRDGTHTTHNTASEFMDFVVNTRRDLTQLAQTNSGRDLFKAIESKPLHKVRIQDAGPNPGIRESSRKDNPDHAVRMPVTMGGMDFDWPNTGTGSVVSHHTDITQRWGEKMPELGGKSPKEFEGVGMSSSLALGHELIHSARSATGWQAPLNPLSNVKPEEKETVGTIDGARTIMTIPTENEMRREMNTKVFSGGGMITDMGIRTRYGGKDIL